MRAESKEFCLLLGLVNVPLCIMFMLGCLKSFCRPCHRILRLTLHRVIEKHSQNTELGKFI